MTFACLVDTTRCVGCRSCQVACKQSNSLEAERTKFFAAPGGYQNPAKFSPHTRTYVSYHELEDEAGGLKWVFLKQQCMHCTDMRCADVCAPGVFRLTASGVVVCDADECIGCAACVTECPFGAPRIEYWGLETPQIRKCSFCFERRQAKLDAVRVNGKPLRGESLRRHQASFHTPACAKACPAGAILFGRRDQLLAEARRRIAADPKRYVDHVYGEKELGGCGWLYLAGVPFEKLGLPVQFVAPAEFKGMGCKDGSRSPVASVWRGIGTLLVAVAWFFKRRDEVRGAPGKDCGKP